LEKRLEGRQAQQHTACLLISLGRHPHVLVVAWMSRRERCNELCL
jgi:hypothetical protein